MARSTKAKASSSKTRKSSKAVDPRTPRKQHHHKSSTTFSNALPTPEDSTRRLSIFDGQPFRVFEPQSPVTVPNQSPRRFSSQYGHGQVLDDTPIPINFASGFKRKTSIDSDTVSPKRVRFSKNDSDKGSGPAVSPGSPLEDVFSTPDSANVEEVEDFSLARQDLSLDDGFELNPGLHLLSSLRDVTEPLSISQIQSLLRILQKLTGNFAAKYFADAINDSEETVAMDMRDFPLEDLKTKHPSLYLTVVNILDASVDDVLVQGEDILENVGWHKFFAHPNYRPFLVSAILGEWFTQRIFKDPAFGLDARGRDWIENGVDKRFVLFDSFVRAKERSKVVEQSREAINADSWLVKAANELADELMIVLSPMMPFANNNDSSLIEISPENAAHKAEIKEALAQLTIHCAVVNLAIVRTGENGTIVRPARRLEKGKLYYKSAPMELCNSNQLRANVDCLPQDSDKKIVVKMTCWPRMEGWAPHGMDMIQMRKCEDDYVMARLPKHLQTKIRRHDKLRRDELKELRDIHSNFCWECAKGDCEWDVLPGELHEVAKNRQLKRERAQKAYERQVKAEMTEDGRPNERQKPVDNTLGGTDREHRQHDDEDNSELPRGSWITEFTCLAPHQVYGEWAKPDEFYTNAANSKGAKPVKSIREINTLENAIKEARQALPLPSYLSAQAEDLVQKLWNFYASHNLAIEWSTFLIAVLVYLSRGNASTVITAPMKLTTAIVNHLYKGFGLLSAVEGISNVSNSVLKAAKTYLGGNNKIFQAIVRNMMDSTNDFWRGSRAKAASGVSKGVKTVTHFIGIREPFTSNPTALGQASMATAAPSSVVAKSADVPSKWFEFVPESVKRPTFTKLVSSAVAAVTAKTTKPVPLSTIGPALTARSVIPIAGDQVHEAVFEEVIEDADIEMPIDETSGIWEDTASAIGGKLGQMFSDSIGRGLMRTRTITVTPGRSYTTVVGGGQMG